MKIKVGISNRHIHMTKEDFEFLFGNIELTKRNDLSQQGEFASNCTVTIRTDKNKIENVRIVGPFRRYTQLEISKTDAYHLGINPPVRMSGNLDGAAKVLIVGPNNSLTKECCIIAKRHIHVKNSELEKYNLKDKDNVKIKIEGLKGGILDNVEVKADESYTFELHIDTDDANSHDLKNGDFVDIT